MEMLTEVLIPFDEDGNIDYQVYIKVIEHVLHQGSDGLVLGRTLGEGTTQSKEEILETVTFISHNYPDIKIVVSVGESSLKQVIDFIEKLDSISIDAIMIDIPRLPEFSRHGVYMYLKTIAKSTSLPIIINNSFKYQGIDLEFRTIKKLLEECNNIIGFKEEGNDFFKLLEIKKYKRNFLIYLGDNNLSIEGLKTKVDGVISFSSHVIGEEIRLLLDDFEQDSINEKLSLKINDFNKLISNESKVSAIKYILTKQSIIKNKLRLPYVPLSLIGQIEVYRYI